MRALRFWSLLLCAVWQMGAQVNAPRAEIGNGIVRASLYLPNAENGYYRGARFDWSGVISRLEYRRHNFFGVWFPKYEPTLHDAITGPVEEFRSDDGALGFGEAKPGELFVKIGVGVLQKPDDEPYTFSRGYKIVSTGTWIVRPYSDRIEFLQELKGVNGYSYAYVKRVKLLKGKPELVLEHALKNTGKRTIDTEVYEHDFYVIDGQPTGPAVSVKFPFAVRTRTDWQGPAKARGNEIVFSRELEHEREDSGVRDSVFGYLEGFGNSATENDIRVENRKAGAGVEETGDHPLSKLAFWSIRTTVCPEAYIKLHIEPGKKLRWAIRYRFYELPAGT